MITCNRCGKENQDHYKFCLGCGNEIKAVPAPAVGVSPASGEAPLSFGTAQTVAPSMAPPVVAPFVGRTATPAASGGLPGMSPISMPSPAGQQKSGIPWNDSPRMPSPPVMPVVAPAALAPTPVASKPAVSEPRTTICTSCGKEVKTGFAFCGVCGARMAPAAAPAPPPPAAAAPPVAPAPDPSVAAAALGAQRTMFMAAPQAPAVAAPRGRLVLIRPDGSEGGTHPLHDGENLIGRGQGSLFDTDAYLSPRHGEFLLNGNGLVVRDLRSLNGVFVKITAEEALQSGDIFRLGQELLRFDVIQQPTPLEDGTEVMGTPNPGFWGRLSVVVGRDVDGSAFPIFGDAIVLGRERGDILFPEDGYVSGAHARISLREGHVYLADLGSSNGTFFRVRGERPVPAGSFILMGQQLFRIEYK